MYPIRHSVRRLILSSLVAAAGLAAAPTAQAQDCKVVPEAVRPAVWFGQTAQINAWACIPPSAYAFASTDFNLLATDGAWNFVSNGAIVGPNVLGINASQPHAPQLGVVADPSNPIRIWTGLFTPTSTTPSLVEFTTLPGPFSYYPSDLTSSTAPCLATGGNEFLFVNPMRIGERGVLAAPGNGTRMSPSGDGGIDALRDPDVPESSVLIGLLLPAVQKCGVGTVFDQAPDNLRVETDVSRVEVGGESFTLNFTKIEYQYTVQSRADNPLPLGMGIVYTNGGRRMGSTSSDHGLLPFLIARTPDRIDTRLATATVGTPNNPATSMLITTLHFDPPVLVQTRKPGERRGEQFEVDTIELRSTFFGDIKKAYLEMQRFEATGASSMHLTPAVP